MKFVRNRPKLNININIRKIFYLKQEWNTYKKEENSETPEGFTKFLQKGRI